MNNAPAIRARRRANGFTLIELMVTIAVAALLVGLAAPTFRDLAIRNELSTYANELISTINYARSEAVRTGGSIVICPTKDDGATCSGFWNNGWVTYLDKDGDGTLDQTKGDVPLKRHGAMSQNYWVDVGTSFSTGLAYKADGSTANTGMFVICHMGDLVGARAVLVKPMRPRVATDTDNNGIPNDESNKDITQCKEPS